MDCVGFASVVGGVKGGGMRSSVICSAGGEKRGGWETSVKGVVAASVGAVLLWAGPGFAVEVARCDNGIGPGCAAAAEGNDFILKLQQRSAEKNEQRQRELLEDYWKRNYGDYFKFDQNKELVKNDDGTWSLKNIDTPEARAMRAVASQIAPSKDKK
ncbi:hypothetical protein NDN08_002637 [Rhodosorus marinus]|uniref:Cathepsin propeptide inhibitor domain-containing protein n=1 Tax=Rhodosorus marinus TaxID=101924 RepID=A0AAV8UUA0_9RHOD|nr:hypothetical protein NDN08_002637 [Rhodosorus marinus]